MNVVDIDGSASIGGNVACGEICLGTNGMGAGQSKAASSCERGL